MQWLPQWYPFITTLLVSSVVIFIASLLVTRINKALTADQRLPRQLSFIAVIIICLIAIILTLPVSESSRNQVLALLGVMVSGVLAFSSTTIVTNLMAGVVLKFNRPFRTGDFIRCNDYFGRVSEKGLLDTEIQTEQRDLISIANNYLINNPVTVIRASGTLVTADVSIGYDVHHDTVTQLLEQASTHAGLSEGFVQVTALGDFSVNYRVSGLLTEIKGLLSAKSRLHTAILDELHNNGVEILSPNVVAQRITDPSRAFIPETRATIKNDAVKDEIPEELAFDKAEQAEQHELELEAKKAQREQLTVARDNATDQDEKTRLQESITAIDEEITGLIADHSKISDAR
ncbi:mechanosensitive ion channel family protein [Alteromonas sp. A079]|uniref:mechanosensitive ion channel family protein n=1 Tax=Alteromonas sp. A079 TaxID=3410268 RepID=UPI003B9F4CAB